MANIIDAVSSAFDTTKDIRINYNVAEKGSASLLTGVFEQSFPQAKKFYSSPDIVNSEETKLAIIYGKTMISSYLVDAGVESSTNDPANILRTYRFVVGDGETGGVVTGPNGSPLENIYIIDKNKAPVPVVDSDGRPTVGDVVLASVLGGAISSIPNIWNTIFNNSKSDPTKNSPVSVS